MFAFAGCFEGANVLHVQPQEFVGLKHVMLNAIDSLCKYINDMIIMGSWKYY